MSRYDRNGALGEGFVESFMNEMASDVLIFCANQPEYRKYRAASQSWNNVIKHLDHSLFNDYDEKVTTAFSEYEKVVVEYFWVLGLIDATKNNSQSKSDIDECVNIPGLEEMEQQLSSVCKDFCNQLATEDRVKCVMNFTHWKERIDNGRYCYYLHGLEFTKTLLERVHINLND